MPLVQSSSLRYSLLRCYPIEFMLPRSPMQMPSALSKDAEVHSVDVVQEFLRVFVLVISSVLVLM